MYRVRLSIPRQERLCKLCLAGIGDEMHMITECVAYAAVRQRHSPLFDCLGGWQHVVDGQVPAYGLKQFMSQEQHQVAAFLVDCSQRRWASSPAEHAEGLGDGASESCCMEGISWPLHPHPPSVQALKVLTWLDSEPYTRELPWVAVATAPPMVWSRNQAKAGRV
jgi:hypothetical protein